MKRLIYSPKVYIFIRSRSRGGQVFDVSDYVTTGSIQRKINAPSIAEFTLKNRFFRFSANKNEPIFLPMDGVTIWMQRIAGRPIQVFTGYLDSVPYMQLYPADAPFKATCTLKRLKHTYFDPGVQATMDFFKKHNWVLTPEGTATNLSGLTELLQTTGTVTDGGMGILLQDFMHDIGGWDPSAVLISDIPRDLPARAAKLYDQLQAGAQAQRDSLESILKGLISLKANDSLSTTGAPAIDNVKKIMDEASKQNVDSWFLTMAALVLSGLQPDHKQEDSSRLDYGYGLFALEPGSGTTVAGTRGGAAATTTSVDIEGYGTGTGASSIYTPANAVKAFIKRLRRNVDNPQLRLDFRSRPYDKTAKLIADGAGKSAHQDLIQAAIETNADLVQQYLGAATNTSYDTQAVSRERPFAYWQVDTASLDWNITWDRVKNDMINQGSGFSQNEQQVLSTDNYTRLQTNYDRTAAFTHVGLQPAFGLTPMEITDTHGETLLVMGGRREALNVSTGVFNYYRWAGSQTSNRGTLEVWYHGYDTATNQERIMYSKNGRQLSDTQSRVFEPTPARVNIPRFNHESNPTNDYVVIRTTDNNNPIDPPYYDGHPLFSNTAATAGPENPNKELHFNDLLKLTFASAFTTQFSFPSNFLESQILSGERALMNDISVLEGVDKLCKASMRHYMSLPSGEFLAFFPDYFGSFDRKPYWSILDTEITNLGINLSDDNLVTHAFVTGGTLTPGEVNFLNKALSLGVVSVEQIFSDQDFVSGGAAFFAGGKVRPEAHDLIQAIGNQQKQGVDTLALSAAFLGTYGLRPMSVENPIIRSQVVEFLYAWQLFMYQWAAQFATRCEFTFMPELMTGGRVALPDHDLELYIESVTHDWNYEDGFTTSATMMAPQSTNKEKWPGMAMATGLSGFGGISTGGIG